MQCNVKSRDWETSKINYLYSSLSLKHRIVSWALTNTCINITFEVHNASSGK